MTTFAKDFSQRSGVATRDAEKRGFINTALGGYYVKRDEAMGRFASWGDARQAAAETKWEVINHLDRYLEEFAAKFEARGGKVFWASNGAQARDYIKALAARTGAKRIVKSKTMTSEEIHLNAALREASYEVVESDLGEYIVELAGQGPYHFVFPSMHMTRHEISKLFEEKLGTAPTSNPEDLTMIARRVLRDVYCTADLGISGANFAIAETGMISITENEGNARLTTSLPRVHVALVGMEKVLPKLSDLALFLPMLSTAGTGQPLTAYNSMLGGPRQPGEVDGPEEFHVILLDNHRSQLLADPEQRDALHCIRCGACLNVCPVFKNVGGHSYGTTYAGPIGSVITPHLRGLQDWKHLSNASSLCGACTSACPVKIDLHHHLLQNRRNAAQEKGDPTERLAWQVFGWMMNHPAWYRLAGRLGWIGQVFHPLIRQTRLDPARAWTATREAPKIATESFKDFWRARKAGGDRTAHRNGTNGKA